MTCNKPPSGDALHGTCRGSVEPLSESGSPRTGHKPTLREQLRSPGHQGEVQPGDLVFCWSVFDEQYVAYQFETHLCSKIVPLCWVINLSDGRRIKKKIRDLLIPLQPGDIYPRI